MRFVVRPIPRARCGRCRKRDAVYLKLCGHCFADDVDKFEKRSRRSRLTVK